MVSNEQRITLSVSSLAWLLVSIPLLFMVWQLRSLLLLVMISVVLAASIAPVVDWAERFRVPRWLGVVFAYLVIIAAFTGIVLLAGPTVVEQIQLLVRQIPLSLRKVLEAAEGWAVSFNNLPW
jgi:predicted PurR-regulated permease PerM